MAKELLISMIEYHSSRVVAYAKAAARDSQDPAIVAEIEKNASGLTHSLQKLSKMH